MRPKEKVLALTLRIPVMAADDLSFLPPAKCDPNGEVSWPGSQAADVIRALAGAGRLVLGLDIRDYETDDYSSKSRGLRTWGRMQAKRMIMRWKLLAMAICRRLGADHLVNHDVSRPLRNRVACDGRRVVLPRSGAELADDYAANR